MATEDSDLSPCQSVHVFDVVFSACVGVFSAFGHLPFQK
jgi:hypothetical protein